MEPNNRCQRSLTASLGHYQERTLAVNAAGSGSQAAALRVGFGALERLKLDEVMNHFVLKAKIYYEGFKRELRALRPLP